MLKINRACISSGDILYGDSSQLNTGLCEICPDKNKPNVNFGFIPHEKHHLPVLK